MFLLISSIVFGISNAKISSIRLGTAFFIPSDKIFKDLYGGGLQHGIEVTFDTWKNAKAWLACRYFSKMGLLSYTKEESHLKIVPLELGLMYIFTNSVVSPYMGIGCSVNFFNEYNPAGSVQDIRFGYLGQAGLLIKLLRKCSLDIKVIYSQCKVKPAQIKADISAVAIFIGAKYHF